MAKRNKKHTYFRATFWKVWISLILTGIVFALMYQLNRGMISHSSGSKWFDKEMYNYGEMITTDVEREWIKETIDGLLIITDDTIEKSAIQTENILKNWLKVHSDVIAVSLSLAGGQRSIRVYKQGFLNEINVMSVPEKKRQELIDFLFNEFKPDQFIQKWNLGPNLDASILGYPVYSIQIPLMKYDKYESIDLKFRLTAFQTILEEKVQEGEYLTLIGPAGELFASIEKEINMLGNGDNVSPMRYSVTIPFKSFPFSLNLTKTFKKSDTQFTKSSIRWIYILSGIVTSFLLAVIISAWIDKPLQKVIDVAQDVARGNFKTSVPLHKNPDLNKLIHLFNYMAEEMDRFRKLDVSEIINEKNKTETILRNIADGVMVTDSQDRILVMNAVAERWFTLQESDILHKPIRKCIRNRALIALLQEVKDGSNQSVTEFSLPGFGSKKRIYQAHAARIQNQDSQLVGVVTVIRDITKEKEVDQIKTELVSMVAHELKSPLTSIYGFSELLLDANLNDPQAKEYTRVILSESTRLTDLVNKFLDLSRLEAGRTQIHISPFDLKQLVMKIIDVNKSQAEKKHIRVVMEIHDDLPLASGDQDLIEQVLVNLFSNAIKYSPEHAKIGIEAKFEKSNILVNVIDNGYGIPKESLGHIFEKFYRVADTENTDEIEGSGLGLALAKEIIEQHGGTITVNSRLGIGSVFCFTLKTAEIK